MSIMRKPLLPSEKMLRPEITETDDEIAKSVQIVLNKLLDCIETFECTCEEHRGSSDLPLEKVKDAPAKKRKPAREPKIVSIPLDDEHGESKPCQKDFCKLGCICKGIESSHKNVLSDHCGLFKCNYSCNYKKYVDQNNSLSMGTNMFSQGMINRLQDEVKKGLAKVEKEFTQMIIKTNNEIIIVGDSRERPTKMPKKYVDFVEEDFNENFPSISSGSKSPRSSKKLQRHLESHLRTNSGIILNGSDEEPPPKAKLVEAIPQDSQPKNIKRKRKQSFVVLEDGSTSDTLIVTSSTQPKVSEMKDLKLLRRNMGLNTHHLQQEFLNSPKEIPGPPPEKTDVDEGKNEFLKLLHRKNGQLWLLRWSTLATHYENGSFQLWYTKAPQQLIITENRQRPSTSHYNIRLFEQFTDISAIPWDVIRWLISKTVPLGKTADQIFLILAYSNNFWKICAICEKNYGSGGNLSISLIDHYCSVEESADEDPSIIDCKVSYNIQKLPQPASENTEVQDENTEAVEHENLQKNKKIMYCSRWRFQPRKLISDSTHDDIVNIQQVLWVSIPSVTLACKWRVICRDLGFAYLSLLRNSYTIKYDDIMKAVKLAQTEKVTIVLKSEELQKNYPHCNFGIYCVPNYLDKIFVGPYFLHENHDLDTLSFVNGFLVNSNLFNRIKGRNVPDSGFWFHQVTTSEDITIIQDPPEIIDLTCDSDDELLGEMAKPTLNGSHVHG